MNIFSKKTKPEKSRRIQKEHKANMQLKKWYDSLPYSQRKEMKCKILDAVKAKPHKWGNWMSHATEIKPLEMAVIEQYLQIKIFNI